MTDTETLLRKAAMAACYKPIRMTMGSEWPTGLLLEGVQEPWNPLTDDGDALRLAAKLRMDLIQSGRVAAVAQVKGAGLVQEFIIAGHSAAAARIAVTKAAAEFYDSQQGAEA